MNKLWHLSQSGVQKGTGEAQKINEPSDEKDGDEKMRLIWEWAELTATAPAQARTGGPEAPIQVGKRQGIPKTLRPPRLDPK